MEEDAGDHDDEGVASEETTVEIGYEADCEGSVKPDKSVKEGAIKSQVCE